MMLKAIRSFFGFSALWNARQNLQVAAFVFAGYWLGAQLAFFIGTLSDKVFAPFWPPNVILLGALLLISRDRSWICAAAAFPAHVLAELQIGMTISSLLVAFAANLLLAILSAMAVRRWLGDPPALDDFHKAIIFVAVVGLASPALVAFAGAFVPVLDGDTLRHYKTYWLQWFTANALGYLTLGPVAVILAGEGIRAFKSAPLARQAEALLLALTLVAVSKLAFDIAAAYPESGFLPTLLYSPVPLILWAAVRFGTKGVGVTIAIMTAVLFSQALNDRGPFLPGTSETNVLSLQIFLMGLTIPMLLLGASIDETRRVGQQLRDDEERMTAIAAEANVGLWQTDTATGLFWTTDHCRTMLGLPLGTAITKDVILSVVHPEDRQIANEAIAAKTLHMSPTEFRIVLPDGTSKWILARSSLNDAACAASPARSGTLSDITMRKAAEAEAELQRRELAHLMRVSQVSELSSGLAHELTQPLTAILSNAQAARSMLTAQPLDLTEIAAVLDDIVQEDHRAGEVIQRLRSFLRNGRNVFETVDLNDLLNSTLRLLRSEIISRRIKTEFIPRPSPALVGGDPVQLQQVLLNLVMNSIESVSHLARLRRTIILKVDNAGTNELEVSVADRGTGISQIDQERLFEPFFTTKEQGLGLGLSICSTIIKRHGGTLTLDNNPSGGATARFRLPQLSAKDRTT
jgi:nitrogen-specific signal transduction histidine kinase/integral membrane sensor domain MASE1